MKNITNFKSFGIKNTKEEISFELDSVVAESLNELFGQGPAIDIYKNLTKKMQAENIGGELDNVIKKMHRAMMESGLDKGTISEILNKIFKKSLDDVNLA